MIELSYVSLFSGIEAFSVAASRVEGVRWNPVFFSEIDPFPCAVLAHHFPTVPNLGDICKIRVDREKGVITNGTTTVALPGAGIDILAGGSPCQDVSVAGKRAGMEAGSGTRSSLAFEYARLVRELAPRIILWENVPGVLSSNGGRDFAAFLDSLAELGYSDLAYAVLDAQYVRSEGFPRAVPQRRRRVWVVGVRSVGRTGADFPVAASILSLFPRVCRNHPPRREAGQGFACPAGYCATGDGRVVGGAGGDDANGEVAAPLCAADGKGKNGMDICGKVAVQAQEDVALGFDARNTGLYGAGATGVEVSMTQDANQYKGGKAVVQGVNCLTPGHPQMHRVYTTEGVAPTLDAHNGAGQNQQAVLVTNSNGEDVMPTLSADEYKMTQAQKDNGGGVLHH